MSTNAPTRRISIYFSPEVARCLKVRCDECDEDMSGFVARVVADARDRDG